MKVRITTRRNAQTGRTTTNTYVSPSGRSYRSYAAVVASIKEATTAASSKSSRVRQSSAAEAFTNSLSADVSNHSDTEPASKRARL